MRASRFVWNDGDLDLAPAPTKTLYVKRRLTNAHAVRAWASTLGIPSTLPPSDMHVTLAYSKAPVDWFLLEPQADELVVADGMRALHQFPPRTTPNGALVLKIESEALARRWQAIMDAGASWDFPEYQPHVTLTYSVPDAGKLGEPYRGPLVFGPEEFSELNENWANEMREEPIAKRRVLLRRRG